MQYLRNFLLFAIHSNLDSNNIFIRTEKKFYYKNSADLETDEVFRNKI